MVSFQCFHIFTSLSIKRCMQYILYTAYVVITNLKYHLSRTCYDYVFESLSIVCTAIYTRILEGDATQLPEAHLLCYKANYHFIICLEISIIRNMKTFNCLFYPFSTLYNGKPTNNIAHQFLELKGVILHRQCQVK